MSIPPGQIGGRKKGTCVLTASVASSGMAKCPGASKTALVTSSEKRKVTSKVA